MALGDQLRRWREAGLIDQDLAARIAAFESSTAAAAPAAGRGVTATEVIAYAGSVVVLAGIGVLIGTRYEQLGEVMRSAILGAVVLAALGFGLLMERRADRAAARRARAAAFLVAAVGSAVFGAEVANDLHLLTRPYPFAPAGELDPIGNFMLGALLGVVASLLLLLRSRSALLAFALGATAFTAFAMLLSWARMKAGWGPVGIALGGGAGLLLLAELMVRWEGRWAAEVLRFTGFLAPTLIALIMSNEPGEESLEAFAGVLAVLGFGGAVLRGSGGLAIAAGIALFVTVVEVGSRHFAQTLGFPLVLIASGFVLLAIAGVLVRLLPALRRPRLHL